MPKPSPDLSSYVVYVRVVTGEPVPCADGGTAEGKWPAQGHAALWGQSRQGLGSLPQCYSPEAQTRTLFCPRRQAVGTAWGLGGGAPPG